MAEIAGPLVSFDRTVSAALESALVPGGELDWLMAALAAAPIPLDVQLRADRRGSRSWISAYAGLTSVLDVHECGGRFRLEAHATHRGVAGFHASWRSAQSAADLSKQREAILEYLARILAPGAVSVRYTGREGRVQTLISTAASDAFGVLQREAVPAFRSAPLRDQLVVPLQQRILGAVEPVPQSPAWWPGVRDRGATMRLGLETDLMGVDDQGRLLVIEVKPSDAVEGIAWAPGQARLYAEVFALWLELDPNASTALAAMAAQRARLSLPTPSWALPEQSKIRVVPVIAIGDGKRSPQALERLAKIHAAMCVAPSLSSRLDQLEVWHHDATGKREHRWRPGFDSVPS